MAYLFTSESVSEGHPDKVADQISDAILDAHLAMDPESRVAVETLVTSNFVVLAGEVRSHADINYEDVARRVIRDIGYTNPRDNFNADTCEIDCRIHGQSPDLAQGVGLGAGDQGMMFGYACRETPELMPLPIMLAHQVVRELAHVRKRTDLMPYLRPDAKSQVTIEYGEGRPMVHTVVLSTQHDESVQLPDIVRDIETIFLPRIFPAAMRAPGFRLFVNPSGRFVEGGPHADAGLTGRKIIVDTYGGRGAHGGGAFSGKDATKVDRSAAYAARYVAKNIVAAGLADSVEVQLAYAIGVQEPVSVHVNTGGTGTLDDDSLVTLVQKAFTLSPLAIINNLNLRSPIFRRTSCYGHFGRDNFPWERLDAVDLLAELASGHLPAAVVT